MAKMYFLKGDDDEKVCSTLNYWKFYMEVNNLKEVELYEAKRITGSDSFYCKEHNEVGEVNEGCGRFCEKYKPNNGKNGRCKHYGYVYECTEIKLVFKHG